MRITKETPMQAAVLAGIDKTAAEIFVLVVKGTFDLFPDGAPPRLSANQRALAFADEYHGDPGLSSIKYACDFPLQKPKTDVIVVGAAHSPKGQPVKALRVGLQVGDAIDKTIQVVGDRRWQMGLLSGWKPSEPEPFATMPLVYERAFGGSDTTHPNPKHHDCHRENLVGVGFHRNMDRAHILDKLLPNLEHPKHPIANWGDTTPTMGYSFVSPNWIPRLNYAGTYDQRWVDARFPFLPDDFDEMYFQTAPADQIVPHLKGGETVTLSNMTAHERFSFALPIFEMPVTFLYGDRDDENYTPVLDTVVIQSDDMCLQLIWRVTTKKTGKLDALREIIIGPMSAKWWRRKKSWKPHYTSLADYITSRS